MAGPTGRIDHLEGKQGFFGIGLRLCFVEEATQAAIKEGRDEGGRRVVRASGLPLVPGSMLELEGR